MRILPPGGFAFASALRAGARLAEAAAPLAADGFDPGAHLVGLIEAGAFQSPVAEGALMSTTADAASRR